MSDKQMGPAFWRSFPIFEEFPEDALAALQAAAIHRAWPAATVLFQRGDAGDHLIALAQGRIKLSLITGAGKELSLRHAEAGSILGDMAVLDGEPRSADAVTVTACEGYVIMRRDFERLITEDAACALATVRYLSRRLRETTDQMESIALYELDARLARFFLATLRQIHGDDLPDEARLAVALSQGELASVLGASRSKINRAIVSLEEQGAISREEGAISFDIDLLEEIAEPLSDLMIRNAQSLPLVTGLLLSLGFALLIHFAPISAIAGIRETVFDALIQLRPQPAAPEVIVVDIDETSDGEGEAAWSRTKTAAMVERLAAAGAAVVAFDLVFSAFCEPGTAGNAELAAAMQKLPVVLGFLLNDRNEGSPAPLPTLAVRQPIATPDLWFAASAEKSCVLFEANAASAGVASLAGDGDARIRVAPSVVVVADAPYPGLALEALRVGKGWPVPIFGGDPPIFRLGQFSIPVDGGANLRLRPTPSAVWAERTIPAAAVLAGTADARLNGAIVFAGSSQPEMGGLRATATSPLEPSVQIHADIATALLAGIAPFRDARASMLEALAAGIGGVLVTLLALWWRPAIVFPIAAGLAAAWVGAVGGVYWSNANLLDPLYPAAAVMIVYAVTSIVRYAATLRAEENLRRRFGQHLPPALVTRFVENPSLLKLEGEERMVTALFTDIEGFTATTKLAGPRELIMMLDGYLGGITHIVISHGGVVDKFVGDAVHAFFNAPLDLDGHADKAIAAAIEIAAFGEAFRMKPENARFAFGRTRIGIESGLAVVGDVGSGEKIDYTAHGNAVNLASRLEAANKELGTAICVGPGAKAGATVALKSFGEIDVRGFGRLEVFSPEPAVGQSPTLA